VRLALKVVMLNEGDFMDIILLYTCIIMYSYNADACHVRAEARSFKIKYDLVHCEILNIFRCTAK
jgi:hypothetical protein